MKKFIFQVLQILEILFRITIKHALNLFINHFMEHLCLILQNWWDHLWNIFYQELNKKNVRVLWYTLWKVLPYHHEPYDQNRSHFFVPCNGLISSYFMFYLFIVYSDCIFFVILMIYFFMSWSYLFISKRIFNKINT